jgi:histone deacetylase 4/5
LLSQRCFLVSRVRGHTGRSCAALSTSTADAAADRHGACSSAIYRELCERGLAARCVRVPARAAERREIERCHSQRHINTFFSLAKRSKKQLRKAAAQYDSVYLNAHSVSSALLAAVSPPALSPASTDAPPQLTPRPDRAWQGGSAELTLEVCHGRLRSGVAVVRPPGHHAECGCAMGFWCGVRCVRCGGRFG